MDVWQKILFFFFFIFPVDFLLSSRRPRWLYLLGWIWQRWGNLGQPLSFSFAVQCLYAVLCVVRYGASWPPSLRLTTVARYGQFSVQSSLHILPQTSRTRTEHARKLLIDIEDYISQASPISPPPPLPVNTNHKSKQKRVAPTVRTSMNVHSLSLLLNMHPLTACFAC